MSSRSLTKKSNVSTRLAELIESAPPELLSVAEVLREYPKQAIPILEREIQHRREYILLAAQARSFVSSRLLDALQGFAVISVVIVSVLWTFRGVTRMRDWLQSIDPRLIPGGGDVFAQWNTLISHSPLASWSWTWLALVVVALVIGILTRHLSVILFSWRDLGPLRKTTQIREMELATLEEWKERLKG